MEASKARASLCVLPLIPTHHSSATRENNLPRERSSLFDWIDKNGPAPKIEPRVVSVDILDSIAVVRLEVAGWSGNLAGSDVRMSDLFTLLKMPGGWKIIQKAFHWHA